VNAVNAPITKPRALPCGASLPAAAPSTPPSEPSSPPPIPPYSAPNFIGSNHGSTIIGILLLLPVKIAHRSRCGDSDFSTLDQFGQQLHHRIRLGSVRQLPHALDQAVNAQSNSRIT